MKKSFLILVLLVINVSLFGVDFNKDTTNKFIAGFYPTVCYYTSVVRSTDNQAVGIFEGGIRPYFAYNVCKNIFVGCNLNYDFVSSSFYERGDLMEVGVFTRYIVPFAVDKRFWNRLHPYIEGGYSLTNYRLVYGTVNNYVSDDGVEVYEKFMISDKLNQSKFSIPIGVNFRLFKGFYLDYNFQYVKYINGSSRLEYLAGIGYSW